jgi:hypothetical protein
VKRILVTLLLSLASLCALGQANFTIPRDVPGRVPTMVRSAPTYVNARVLAAGVSETSTMPADTRLVIFSANCDFYASPGASAAVPAADVTDGTASELNPTAWYFANAAGATQQVSVITSAATCIITITGYKGRLE